MELYLPYVMLALLFTECIAGIVFNIFIVATNIQNWRKLQLCDKILSCLATSRCFFLLHMMEIDFFILSFPRFLRNPVLSSALLVGTMFLNHINLWFASVLCVFYCVKITAYNSPLFIFLKSRISSLVHWLLLVSLPVSIACSLPCGWFIFNVRLLNMNSTSVENLTLTQSTMHQNLQIRFLMFSVGSIPPFLIFCVAICLLIHSLWLHIRHMRSSGTGHGTPNVEVHVCAVKSMVLFLVLHVVYFTCMNLRLSPTLQISRVWMTLIMIIACSPALLHSLYIISSTRKLKDTFLRWFCHQ